MHIHQIKQSGNLFNYFLRYLQINHGTLSLDTNTWFGCGYNCMRSLSFKYDFSQRKEKSKIWVLYHKISPKLQQFLLVNVRQNLNISINFEMKAFFCIHS